MSVKIVNGDLLDAHAAYICHQVNCRGRMASGVAGQIRAKYPEAFRAYSERCDGRRSRDDPLEMLGRTQFVRCGDGVTVINMFSQEGYGRDGGQYTDYEAFRSCLREIHNAVPADAVIAMPYGIGCGLGGGDWNIIFELIKEELSDHTVELWKIEK